MDVRFGALVERLRSSLFFVPMLFVIVGGALGLGMIKVDTTIETGATSLPFVLTSTVDSAREVLSIVASATITVAGIAFSVALLIIQQASSQFSPRVVHSLFRDPFNRRVMGIAVGTFTYCLMVLRAVRGSLEDGGEPVIPNLSVNVSVVLGVVAILAIVAFIDHNAHTMEVSEILARVTGDAVGQIERLWPEGSSSSPEAAPPPPSGRGHTVPFTSSGWLQQVSVAGLLDIVPDGGTVRMETSVGRYAVKGTPLCTIWPAPDDPAAAVDRAAGATQVGAVRTMQQDASYGVRQLADVALIALSPGVNDPTTAQDAIFHLVEVLREMLVRDLPPVVERDDRGRCVVHAESHTYETLVQLAFDEIRRDAAARPTVCIYLLEAMHLLHAALLDAGLPDRAALLRLQAERVIEGAERSDVLPTDLREVRAAFERRFGDSTT